MGIPGKVWASIAGIIAIAVILLALIFGGQITSENVGQVIVPPIGMILAIIVLTLLFAGKEKE